MQGMCDRTGKIIEGRAYLSQCIRRILRNPKMSRLGDRSFGSNLISLLDRPSDAETILDMSSEISVVLESQIKGLKVSNVSFSEANSDGSTKVMIELNYENKTYIEEI